MTELSILARQETHHWPPVQGAIVENKVKYVHDLWN